MESPQFSGNHLLKTVGACIAAPVVALVCAVLSGGIWAALNSILKIIRPEIIGFIAAVLGAFAGMYCYRIFCDKYLNVYVPQVVFFVMIFLLLEMIYLYAFMINFELKHISSDA